MATSGIPPLSELKRWQPSNPVLAAWIVLIGVSGFTYWTTLRKVVWTWSTSPDYTHGFLVPIFSLFLLWYRQDMVNPWPRKGSWWAIPFFIAWAAMRWLIFFLNYERDLDSLYPFLIGVTLMLGGWKALRWAWPSIAFLFFMIPLPDVVASKMALPLQHVATKMTVYTLQTVGVPAIIKGDQSNVIQLSAPDNQLEVAHACSGLRMLTLFFAMCVGAAFVMNIRPLDRIVIVVSAIPIAILSNVARITTTGMVAEWISPAIGHFFHDWFGPAMMVIALLMIWGEVRLLANLLIEDKVEGPLALGGIGNFERAKPPNTVRGPG